jgi:hypothetical protein
MKSNGSKFKSLKSCLHEDNLFTPLIILMTSITESDELAATL